MWLSQGSSGPNVVYAKRYFDSLGYKINIHNDTFDFPMKLVVQGFQDNVHLDNDGIIGPLTEGAMKKYDKFSYCPEVFEDIKPARLIGSGAIKPLLLYRLAGLEEVFVQSATMYNVDVLHIIAHAILESGWGRSWIARFKKNLFGVGAYDSSPAASAWTFKSYKLCIPAWTRWWNKNYLLPDGAFFNGCNEYGVNVKYASSPVAGANKAFIVRSLRNAIGG